MSQSLRFCISVAPNMAAFMDLSLHVREIRHLPLIPGTHGAWQRWPQFLQAC